MTASFGNSPEPPVDLEATTEVTPAPNVLLETAEKKGYLKPALKQLGLLRSVTGSNLSW